VGEELGDLRAGRAPSAGHTVPRIASACGGLTAVTEVEAGQAPAPGVAEGGRRALPGWLGLAAAVLAVVALTQTPPTHHPTPTPAAPSRVQSGLLDVGAAVSPDVVDLSGQQPPVRPGDLCHLVPHLAHLTVRRVEDLPQNRLRFTIPAVTDVDDAGQVQAVAQVVCGLPVMPDGVYHCPADLGVTQHLTFATTTQTLPTVVVTAGGCQTVTGLGPVRWSADPLWPALRSALHVPGSLSAAFFGVLPPTTA
jgi:hypothetical protein